jgi:hypothetical protein
MRIIGDAANAGELERLPFELWIATNTFGDEFAVLRALVPLKTYREMPGGVDTYQPRTRYESVFRALDNVGKPVRFIGMDVVEEIPTATNGPKILKKTKVRYLASRRMENR